MAQDQEQLAGSGKKPVEKEKEPKKEEVGESCRCEEVARKTPRELFRLMLSDLAFWRRKKK